MSVTNVKRTSAVNTASKPNQAFINIVNLLLSYSRLVATDLVLHCLLMSNKMNAKLIWVKCVFILFLLGSTPTMKNCYSWEGKHLKMACACINDINQNIDSQSTGY